MDISIVVPVFKAEDCLEELYRRLKTVLDGITKNYEIILIEDCGNDNSWKIINELKIIDNKIKGIQFSRNFGQHYAITAGLDNSKGRYVVVMDCDLQDQPEAIPMLYSKAKEGFDVVLAKRKFRKHKATKILLSALFYKLFSFLSGLDYDGEVGNFRIISRQVVDNLCTMKERLRFFGGMVEWVGFPVATVDVEHAKRFSGETTYTYRKLWKLAIDTIIAYSDKPLRIAIKIGFLMSFISFIYGTYFLIKAIIDKSPVLGWSSLIVSFFFIGGIIIFILGIIGIYLGKTFDQTKNRPLYIIRREI
jgi:dolichol-phosphate mannosyltransferase